MTATRNRISLPWKIHTPDGTLTGSAAHPEDAARFLSGMPKGTHCKADDRTVYVVGTDPDPFESFDAAAEIMATRRSALARATEAMRSARALGRSVPVAASTTPATA